MAKVGPRRPRRLLLHRKQAETIAGAVSREGATLVPLDNHFNDRCVAKLDLGLAEGKTKANKRQAIAERDWKRDKARLMREKG